MKASGSIFLNRENLAKVKKIDSHTKSSVTYFQRCCVRGNSCIKTELAKGEKARLQYSGVRVEYKRSTRGVRTPGVSFFPPLELADVICLKEFLTEMIPKKTNGDMNEKTFSSVSQNSLY
jgi:hypothetical protein